MQSQVAELLPEGLAGDAEEPGRLSKTPLRVFKHNAQQDPVDLAVGLRIQVVGVGAEPLENEGLEVDIVDRRRRRGRIVRDNRNSRRYRRGAGTTEAGPIPVPGAGPS